MDHSCVYPIAKPSLWGYALNYYTITVFDKPIWGAEKNENIPNMFSLTHYRAVNAFQLQPFGLSLLYYYYVCIFKM